MTVLVAGILAGSAAVAAGSERAGDAAAAYADHLRQWRGPADVHAWIARNFTYDRNRAVALSETQRLRGAPFRIYEAAEFYREPSGVCVDLARFAVETLQQIAPETEPRYLRITFDPVRIEGNVLRMHWLVSYRADGKFYFFADSNRPDVLAGPYDTVEDFVRSYDDVRGRMILSHALVESFRKQERKERRRKERSASAPGVERN